MAKVSLTESERWVLINALGVARSEYEKAANDNPDETRMQGQYARQAKDVAKLAERIEQADAIDIWE